LKDNDPLMRSSFYVDGYGVRHARNEILCADACQISLVAVVCCTLVSQRTLQPFQVMRTAIREQVAGSPAVKLVDLKAPPPLQPGSRYRARS